MTSRMPMRGDRRYHGALLERGSELFVHHGWTTPTNLPFAQGLQPRPPGGFTGLGRSRE